MKASSPENAGAEQFGNVAFTRKEFKPLILWRPKRADECEGSQRDLNARAPDNLTHAFGSSRSATTRNSQFARGRCDPFAVSKKLLIEPALPLIPKEGDQVELRAVAPPKRFPILSNLDLGRLHRRR